MKFFEKNAQGFILRVIVQPNCKKNEFIGLYGKPLRLKVKLSSPPIEGKANKDLLLFLSRSLKLPKSKFSLLRGHTSRMKDVLIETEQDLSCFFNQFFLSGFDA